MKSQKKRIDIRGIDANVLDTLKLMSNEYKFTSFNQFMLYQLDLIVQNHGINIFQNLFADFLLEMKTNQREIFEELLKQDIQRINIVNRLDTIEILLKRWIELTEVIDSGQL